MSFTYTVLQLKTDLENSLHGTTLNRVQGVNQIIHRAASELLLELDPQETIRTTQLTSPIFEQVYDYALPVDLKGTKIIDIKPQANRTYLDRYLSGYNQSFDISKTYTKQPNFSVQFNKGNKFIKINNNLLVTGVLLNQVDTISGNGLWVASNGATNLTQDNSYFINGASSSLSFDTLSVLTTATLTNSTMDAVDLSEQYLQAHQFLYTFLPTASNFSSVELRFGSSASNYYSETFTMTQSGTAFEDGWNLLDGDWADATTVGTPDITAIDYIQVNWTYDGSVMAGVRLNQLYSRMGVISEIEYYSKYLFQNATTGAFQETITDDSNIINLDTETRNLIYLLTCSYAVQQIQGMDAMFYDSQYFQQKYAIALANYKAQYKSQWQKPKSTYYKMPNSQYRNWIGSRNN